MRNVKLALTFFTASSKYILMKHKNINNHPYRFFDIKAPQTPQTHSIPYNNITTKQQKLFLVWL